MTFNDMTFAEMYDQASAAGLTAEDMRRNALNHIAHYERMAAAADKAAASSYHKADGAS